MMEERQQISVFTSITLGVTVILLCSIITVSVLNYTPPPIIPPQDENVLLTVVPDHITTERKVKLRIENIGQKMLGFSEAYEIEKLEDGE